jgi:hypothetical protein
MVYRIEKPDSSPVAGASLKRPDGSVYIQLPENPFNPAEEALKPESEQRKVDPSTGYYVKTVEQLKQGQ